MANKFTPKVPTNRDEEAYEVLKSTTRPDVIGVNVGGEHKFDERNRFITHDRGLAKEIHDTVGQGGTNDVVVTPTRIKKEPDHKYTFVVPELPWKKDNK